MDLAQLFAGMGQGAGQPAVPPALADILMRLMQQGQGVVNAPLPSNEDQALSHSVPGYDNFIRQHQPPMDVGMAQNPARIMMPNPFGMGANYNDAPRLDDDGSLWYSLNRLQFDKAP